MILAPWALATGPQDHDNAHRAVLVVDDDADTRTMLRSLLELDDHEVMEAEDGKVAWKMIRRHRPAVVVTDLQMPRLDGLALCRRIRDSRFKQVKLIVYSGRPLTDGEAKQANADAHLIKTEPLPRLRQMIARLLRQTAR